MNILQISANDIIGAQANGYMLHKYYLEKNYDSNMIVYAKKSTDKKVYLLNSALLNRLNGIIVRLQSLLSLEFMLNPLGLQILFMKTFWKANVVNFQLIHGGQFISLFMLPVIAYFKKCTLLTIHDMFFMTGHCIHAMDCERWKTGCGLCPDLQMPFSIKRDTTAMIWKIKKWIFKHSKIHLVVGSDWQYQRVQSSPLLNHLPMHYIPYGVDKVYDLRDKKICRAMLQIPEDADVIAFRYGESVSTFKGGKYTEEALSRYSPKKKTYLIIFQSLGFPAALKEKFHCIEYNWMNNEPNKIALALNAADIFLMPSLAESFGLMAIEAMACGVPSIVFEGTALPKTINAPHCGIAVPAKDVEALTNAIDLLLTNTAYREALSTEGLEYVKKHHTLEVYGDNYLALYQKLYRQTISHHTAG